MTIFAGHVDWSGLLRDVCAHGWGVAPAALDEGFRIRLEEEARSGPFALERVEAATVRGEYDSWRVDDLDALAPQSPCLALARALPELLAPSADLAPGLRELRFNRASFQRYRPGQLGITAHRDPARNRVLVAVVGVCGRGEFGVVEQRDAAADDDGTVIDTGPGDLILLWAPGLDAQADVRALHLARPPAHGERISLGLRMEC